MELSNSSYRKQCMHKNTKATKRFWIKHESLTLQEEGCTTLSPPCLVTTARHVETCDCPVTISIVVDWDRDAFARWIGVSGILQRNKGSTDQVKWPFNDQSNHYTLKAVFHNRELRDKKSFDRFAKQTNKHASKQK